MGMHTYIKCYVSENDVNYQKHKKVMEACLEAGIKKLPKETADYFGCDYPSNEFLTEKLSVKIPFKVISDNKDARDIYEIIVSEIPNGVHKIQFINSF